MPIFSILYFVFILSNFGFPGTCNFVGEFLVLCGGYIVSVIILVFSTFGMILALMYSLFLYNRLFFGSLQEWFIRYYCDCSRLEFLIISCLSSLVVLGGFYPNFIFRISFNTLAFIISSKIN